MEQLVVDWSAEMSDQSQADAALQAANSTSGSSQCKKLQHQSRESLDRIQCCRWTCPSVIKLSFIEARVKQHTVTVEITSLHINTCYSRLDITLAPVLKL